MAILLGSKDLDHLCTTWMIIVMPDDCNRWNHNFFTLSVVAFQEFFLCFWIQSSCSSPWRELREVNCLCKSFYGKGLISLACALVGERRLPLSTHIYPALFPPPWGLCETGPGMSLQLLMVQIMLTLLVEMNKEKQTQQYPGYSHLSPMSSSKFAERRWRQVLRYYLTRNSSSC